MTNPLTYVFTWRSPRLRLLLISFGVVLAAYIISFTTIFFPFIGYLFPFMYSYPLIHVVLTTFESNRNSFRW